MSVISSLAHYDSDEELDIDNPTTDVSVVADRHDVVNSTPVVVHQVDSFKPPTPFNFFSNPLKPPTPAGATVFSSSASVDNPPSSAPHDDDDHPEEDFVAPEDIGVPAETVADYIRPASDPDPPISPDDEERREHRAPVDEIDESEMDEPPPPARPDNFGTPSPTASRSSSPKAAEDITAGVLSRLAVSNSGPAINRIASYSGLVSYAAEGEEDDDEADERSDVGRSPHSRSGSEASDDETGTGAKQGDEKGLSMDVKSDDADIDVDAYLEQALEAGLENNKEVRRVNGRLLKLPPKPLGKCPQELQDKIDSFLAKKRSGTDPIAAIQNSKKFRNPSMYEKLINMMGIDEIGSNFPKKTFDPHGFKPTDFYDELAKQQKIAMDKVEKDKLTQKPADLGSHSASKSHDNTASATSSAAMSESQKKKSKWDNPVAASSVNADSSSSGPSGHFHQSAVGPVGGIPVVTYQVGQAAKMVAALQQQHSSSAAKL